MNIHGANMPYNKASSFGTGFKNSWDLSSALNGKTIGTNNSNSGKDSFANFMVDQAKNTITDLKATEHDVEQFSKGNLDIEIVAPKVAKAGLEVEVLARTISVGTEAVKTIVNMQV
jgi:flagellar hook-basal body complex protein FliE